MRRSLAAPFANWLHTTMSVRQYKCTGCDKNTYMTFFCFTLISILHNIIVALKYSIFLLCGTCSWSYFPKPCSLGTSGHGPFTPACRARWLTAVGNIFCECCHCRPYRFQGFCYRYNMFVLHCGAPGRQTQFLPAALPSLANASHLSIFGAPRSSLPSLSTSNVVLFICTSM